MLYLTENLQAGSLNFIWFKTIMLSNTLKLMKTKCLSTKTELYKEGKFPWAFLTDNWFTIYPKGVQVKNSPYEKLTNKMLQTRSALRHPKKGRLECNLKYIEQNPFTYFLFMQQTTRGLLTTEALHDCHEAKMVR